MSENFVQRAFAFIAITLVIVSVVLCICCFFVNPTLAAQSWFLEGGGFNWSKLVFFGGLVTNKWIAALCWIGMAILTYSLGAMFAPESMQKYGARFSKGVSRALRSVAAAVKTVLTAAVSAIPWWIWAAGGLVLVYWISKPSVNSEDTAVQSRDPRHQSAKEDDHHELVEEG